jgi:phospholipid-binding lipoprotein MlaA
MPGGGWKARLFTLALSALAIGGCGTMSGFSSQPELAMGVVRSEPTPSTPATEDVLALDDSVLRPEDYRGVLLASADPLFAQAPPSTGDRQPSLDTEPEEYDPWEPFNTKMFELNRSLDRYIIKPVAQAWDFVFPDVVKESIDNGFRNLGVVPRVANSLFQGRFKAAGVETGRFLINSTFGIGGLFDIANQEFGLRPIRADFGQTLGVFDTPPGPYLVLPLLPPFTVRDAIGYGVDGAMNPLAYVIPFIWERLVMTVVDAINSRALNLEVFQGIEETTLDLYTAVRNAYLARRARLIEDAIAESYWKRQASP